MIGDWKILRRKQSMLMKPKGLVECHQTLPSLTDSPGPVVPPSWQPQPQYEFHDKLADVIATKSGTSFSLCSQPTPCLINFHSPSMTDSPGPVFHAVYFSCFNCIVWLLLSQCWYDLFAYQLSREYISLFLCAFVTSYIKNLRFTCKFSLCTHEEPL